MLCRLFEFCVVPTKSWKPLETLGPKELLKPCDPQDMSHFESFDPEKPRASETIPRPRLWDLKGHKCKARADYDSIDPKILGKGWHSSNIIDAFVKALCCWQKENNGEHVHR